MPAKRKRAPFQSTQVPVAGHDLAGVITGMIVGRWRLEEPGHPHHGHVFVVSAIGPTGHLFLTNTTQPGEHYTEVESLDGFSPVAPRPGAVDG